MKTLKETGEFQTPCVDFTENYFDVVLLTGGSTVSCLVTYHILTATDRFVDPKTLI